LAANNYPPLSFYAIGRLGKVFGDPLYVGRALSIVGLLCVATAWWALQGHRFKALRCGRRWGKTDFAKIWIGDGLARGMECGWFAPPHKTWSEATLGLWRHFAIWRQRGGAAYLESQETLVDGDAGIE
jgi:hypothetical protein